MYIGVKTPEREGVLTCEFNKAGTSLFMLRKSTYIPDPNGGPTYQSPWVGKPLTSLLNGDEAEDMLKILKDQHAYVLAQHNYLIRKHQNTQVTTQTEQRESIQSQQMALIRDTLLSFQESITTMMKVTSEMVQKVCEAQLPVAAAIPPPIFEKSARSHRRPAIRVVAPAANGNLALKIHDLEVEDTSSKPIRVQPHPISKRLERMSDER